MRDQPVTHKGRVRASKGGEALAGAGQLACPYEEKRNNRIKKRKIGREKERGKRRLSVFLHDLCYESSASEWDGQL